MEEPATTIMGTNNYIPCGTCLADTYVPEHFFLGAYRKYHRLQRVKMAEQNSWKIQGYANTDCSFNVNCR